MGETVNETASILNELSLRISGLTARMAPKDFFHPAEICNALEELISESQFASLNSVLRIGVAGFIFVDQETKKIVRLFTKGTETAGFYQTYSWLDDTNQKYEEGLQYLFDIWRDHERIDGDPDFYPPEYLFYLPVEEACANACWHPLENSLRRLTRCHYVPQGEILFFCLMWRLALISTAASKPVREYCAVADVPLDIGDRIFLWDSLVSASLPGRERQIVNSWNSKTLIESFRLLLRVMDTTYSFESTLVRDLINLNLLTMHGPETGDGIPRYIGTKRLMSLLRFMEFVTAKLSPDSMSESPMEYHTYYTASQDISLSDIRNILYNLWWTFSLMIGEHEDANDSEFLLSAIHTHARFPVIPYYYWWLIEPQSPKCHLAVPVHHSYSKPEVIRGFDSSVLHPHYCGYTHAKVARSNAVGFAVAGIEPLFDFDWTIQEEDFELAVPLRNDDRFSLIRAYCRSIAIPLIDQVFYVRTRDLTLKKSIASDLSHGTPAEILSAAREVVRLRLKLSPGDSSGLIKELSGIEQRLHRIILGLYRKSLLLDPGGRTNTELPLKDTLNDIVESIKYNAEAKDVVFSVDARNDKIVFNSTMLLLILDELIKNTMRHSERRFPIKITIVGTTSIDDETLRGRGCHTSGMDKIMITYTDNGIGIHPELKEAIFQRTQGSVSSSEGQGIGLPNLREVLQIWSWSSAIGLELFKTNIWEDGIYESSARFNFVIPIRRN